MTPTIRPARPRRRSRVDEQVLQNHIAFHADHFGNVVMRREPSRRREAWTIVRTAPAIFAHGLRRRL